MPDNILLNFSTMHLPASGPGRSRFLSAQPMLAERQLQSSQQILTEYPYFTLDERFVVICYIMHENITLATPLLLAELNSPDATIGGAASAAVARIATESQALELISGVRELNDDIRKRVISCLSQLFDVAALRACVPFFLELIASDHHTAAERAFAVYGISRYLDSGPVHDRIYADAMLGFQYALVDASPEVREVAAEFSYLK